MFNQGMKRPRIDNEGNMPMDGGYGQRPEPNRILLLTVLKPSYPITTEVLFSICSPIATVLKIVIFQKNGLKAMIEFENVAVASKVLERLNGCDIYSGCCTLKIEFAMQTALAVRKNDENTWDYTNPNLGSSSTYANRPPLLQNPGASNSGRSGPPGFRGPPPSDRQGEYSSNSGRSGPPQGMRGPPPTMRRDDQSYTSDSQDMYNDGDFMSGYGEMGPSPVCMIYGLNGDHMNPRRVFNLFCLYGNVGRVKFLKSIEGSAMIQMSTGEEVTRLVHFLNNAAIFGNKLRLNHSKQTFINEVTSPFPLGDGSDSYDDFQQSRNNRFLTQESANKNRLQPPSRTLHYFNAPHPYTEEDVSNLIGEEEFLKKPINVKKFDSKSDRSSGGVMEFETESDATEVLAVMNHRSIPNPGGKFPYIFKLCFSNNPRPPPQS